MIDLATFVLSVVELAPSTLRKELVIILVVPPHEKISARATCRQWREFVRASRGWVRRRKQGHRKVDPAHMWKTAWKNDPALGVISIQ